jgi:LPXTG-site transpeptidase (sortase) family protein
MRLSRVNSLLLIAIIAINTYVIAAPILPAASYWLQNRSGQKRQALEAKLQPVSSTAQPDSPNSLVAPAMLLDQPILEGVKSDMYRVLDKGIWRWPDSSTPDRGGNTVLLGHRFTYTNPQGALYYLDKLRVGDSIGMVWNGKTYVYTVQQVKTVRPDDTSILAPTDLPTLTIYTCTPLWLPRDRLVVTAILQEGAIR